MVVTISLWCKHTLLAIKNQNITSIIWKYDIYIHFTISSSCKSFSLICFHSVWQNTGILIFFLSISSLSQSLLRWAPPLFCAWWRQTIRRVCVCMRVCACWSTLAQGVCLTGALACGLCLRTQIKAWPTVDGRSVAVPASKQVSFPSTSSLI